MVKYYEHSPEMQIEVNRLLDAANGPPTIVKRDTTIYPNNNKDKPFSMEGIEDRLSEPIVTSPEIERQRKICDEGSKKKQNESGISDYNYKRIQEIIDMVGKK